MPTAGRPDVAARVAVARAARAPVVFGYETRTIVQPLTLAGHAVRPFADGFAGCVRGSGAVGSAVGATGAAIETCAGTEAKPGPPLLCASATAIDATAPAAATTSASSAVHTQSPGYHPKRVIQRRRRVATRPVTAGSARPQSRQ